MYSKKTMHFLISILYVSFISIANAQEVRVIDNKGTIKSYLKPTIAELYDTTGGLTIPFNTSGVLSAGVIIEFDTPGIIDSNDYSTTITSIKILTTGTYKVTYRVTADVTGNNRSGTEYILLKNTTVVPGSYSASYHRRADAGKDTASASRILALVQDDVLEVRGNQYTGSNTQTVANGSSFLVERIK
jgi:hypothetical protein